jgi:DeoR family transcriptional regulator of aga operon
MPDEELPAALRRDRISALIRERGFVRVAELSRIFRTSPVTIRSDLDHLEDLDLVRRVHGGAVSTSGTAVGSDAPSIDPKAEAKAAIGAVGASLVESGQTLVLGNGTTTQAVARALARRDNLESLTVITNGLQIALELQPAIPRMTLILTGGTLRKDAPALVDPLADIILRNISADVAIVGCKGISMGNGVSDDHIPGVALNRRLLATGKRRVVVADSTKVGASSVARFWDARDIDVLVTEESSDPETLAELREAGVRVETIV